MASVSEHYAQLLGPIYGWMVGDPDEALATARREVASLRPLHTGRIAADLGAGLGFHTVALAEEGYHVTALDADPGLLEALRDRVGSLSVHALQGDLATFPRHVPGPPSVVLCMGDTLTHLPSRGAVETLADEVARALAPGGVFCTTFRDYTVPLEGEARFIPVRRDQDRTLTAFLEYEEGSVMVHDLLHEQEPEGWTLRVSSYRKLRLSPAWVAALFEKRGMQVHRGAGPRGMVRIVARAAP